ncbi:hypothetical protein AVEN_71524-1 [Araneus ventricosus]|uniref:PiggyBac transposable element-derived protein domain-containing protein n=1 Tax=Araneus ventricosus TaxID=182803 RepID=A0A4Y2QE67_ARAVE|nr:hypothetical protein AVEN_71524-1 [Araneus ventricosus]
MEVMMSKKLQKEMKQIWSHSGLNIDVDRIEKTNRYAEQRIDESTAKPKSSVCRWKPTEVVEMEKFLGLIFAMGLIKKSRLEDYWSSDPVLATPIFNDAMA